MKSVLAVLFLAIFLSGCKFGCSIQDSVSGAIASGLSGALQCTNGPQVLADVKSLVGKTNICTAPAQVPGTKGGPIAMIICPVLSSLAVSELGNNIPASWGCQAGLAKGGLSAALTAACNIIPF